jgi:tetratricopeptide (TPR) repeat protein
MIKSMGNASPHQIHLKAEQAREQDNHIEALKLLEEAIIGYQKEGNYSGFTRALQSRFLTYKHLFYLTSDQVFALMGQKDAETSLAIAEKHNLSSLIGSCHFRLGEAAMLFKDYGKATQHYQLALANYQGTNTERADYRYHLGEAFYRSGKKVEGKQTILQGLKEIQENVGEVDSFLAHVWESGCHMRLAELLKEDAPKEAKKHLVEARKIAQSDDKLVIRRRQIEEISKSF